MVRFWLGKSRFQTNIALYRNWPSIASCLWQWSCVHTNTWMQKTESKEKYRKRMLSTSLLMLSVIDTPLSLSLSLRHFLSLFPFLALSVSLFIFLYLFLLLYLSLFLTLFISLSISLSLSSSFSLFFSFSIFLSFSLSFPLFLFLTLFLSLSISLSLSLSFYLTLFLILLSIFFLYVLSFSLWCGVRHRSSLSYLTIEMEWSIVYLRWWQRVTFEHIRWNFHFNSIAYFTLSLELSC